jgi:FixJ family two-component response regulator
LSFGALLVDLQMPGMHGLELQSRLAELNIKLPVVVITAHGDVSSAVRAMRGGAADFVEKPFTSQEILRSIGIALGGDGAPPQTDPRREAITRRIKMLSGREREVMLGMVSGKPNKAIANHLGLSPRTVEIHRARVMTKMEAGSLSELVRTALAAGVVPAG